MSKYNLEKSILFKFIYFGLVVTYPFWVYFALHSGFSVLSLAAILSLIALCSFLRERRLLPLFLVCLLVVFAISLKSTVPLKFYPVVMNGLFFSMFALSLRGENLIERFIRLKGEELTESKKIYARKLTIVWSVIIGINTLVSLATVFASDEVWTFYNGFLSYIVIGLVFFIEYLVRCRLKNSF